VREVSALLGKPPPQREISVNVLRVVAMAGEFVSNFTGKRPGITREIVDSMSKNATVTSAKAQRELDYRIVSLKEMVKDCYEWMVAEGRI
jgi:dihydroflavonol-4-reductase